MAMHARVVVAATAALSLTCGGPRRVGEQPSWRKPSASAAAAPVVAPTGPIELTPAAPPAMVYNQPPRLAPPSSPLGDAVVAEVAAVAASLPTPVTIPVADGRLYAAADLIAGVVPAQGVIPYPLVEFALQHNGIIEPSPHLLVVWGPADPPGPVVEQLRTRLADVLGTGEVTRIGVGRSERNGGVVVVALQGSHLETAPIPRRLDVMGRVPLTGRIGGGFSDPEVFVTRDDGVVRRLSLATDVDGAITTELACDGRRGRQQVEVTASDQTGSTVLANFPLWCGEDPPRSAIAEITIDDSAPVTTAAEAEARMLELVNHDRAAAGLPALIADPRVADVARAHSVEMHQTGVVGHVSPTTGSAADRVRAAGIRTGVVLENIARAYGVGEAEAGLMNSPGHRANLMSAAATHLGIGIELGDEVSGRREMFVTQVFIRIPPPVDPTAIRATLRERLRAVQSFGDDATLDTIAGAYAAALAAGTPHKEAAARASRALEQVANRFTRVASMVTAVGDLADIDPTAFFTGGQFSHVGIGVAQGDHPDLGPGTLHVVVLLAQAR